MPNPAPETQRLVQAAKEARQENLQPDEFKKVLDDQEGTREEVKKMTWQELEQFRANIAREEDEHQDIVAVADTKSKLDALRQEIETGIAAKAPTVQDLEAPEDPNKPKTLVDQVKDVFGNVGNGAMGTLVRGWISLQRTLIDLGVVQGDKDKLGKLEELYGKWFGGAEMRDIMEKALKDSGIEMRKGKKEGVAYHQLMTEYQKEIETQLTRKGPDGKDMPVSAAEMNALKTSFTMKVFLEQKADAYAKKNVAPAVAGEKRVTTLMGVLRGEKPGVEKV